jgi:predicted nucleic acid-binding protein
VIAYFDTSVVVPLFIDEPSSERCVRLWNEASRVISARLLYPEARAALAAAERARRVTRGQHTRAILELDGVVAQVDHVEIDARLAVHAGELAHLHGLRGYDAVHLAAAVSVADTDVVLITGDVDLATAAEAMGLAVALTTP